MEQAIWFAVVAAAAFTGGAAWLVAHHVVSNIRIALGRANRTADRNAVSLKSALSELAEARLQAVELHLLLDPEVAADAERRKLPSGLPTVYTGTGPLSIDRVALGDVWVHPARGRLVFGDDGWQPKADGPGDTLVDLVKQLLTKLRGERDAAIRDRDEANGIAEQAVAATDLAEGKLAEAEVHIDTLASIIEEGRQALGAAGDEVLREAANRVVGERDAAREECEAGRTQAGEVRALIDPEVASEPGDKLADLVKRLLTKLRGTEEGRKSAAEALGRANKELLAARAHIRRGLKAADADDRTDDDFTLDALADRLFHAVADRKRRFDNATEERDDARRQRDIAKRDLGAWREKCKTAEADADKLRKANAEMGKLATEASRLRTAAEGVSADLRAERDEERERVMTLEGEVAELERENKLYAVGRKEIGVRVLQGKAGRWRWSRTVDGKTVANGPGSYGDREKAVEAAKDAHPGLRVVVAT